MHIGYIYMTTCLINGNKYIGLHKTQNVIQTQELDEDYLGSGILLLKAIKKHGKDLFTVQILLWCDSLEELNSAEEYYIDYYNAVEDETFYNVSRGGGGHKCDPWNKDKHGVQEWTQAMEEAFEKGRHLPASDKLKEKLREYNSYRKAHKEEFTESYTKMRENLVKYYSDNPVTMMIDTEGKKHRVDNRDVDNKKLLNWEEYYDESYKDILYKLYIEDNLSRAQVAELLNMTFCRVKSLLHEFNIKKRSI